MERESETKIGAMLEEIRRSGQLPALDRNVDDICRIAGDSQTSLVDLTAVILRDPAMTSYILSAANSAAYRTTSDPVRTVSAAVVMLGFERVRSLAMGMFIFKQSKDSVKSRDLYRLFTCAYFAGSFCVALARRARQANPEELFVAGLLHELPRLLLANTYPDKYREMESLALKEGVTTESACLRVFGVSFAGLGGAVAEIWNLPDTVLATLGSSATGTSPRVALVRESGLLADMIFGNASGGAVSFGAVQRSLRTLLKDEFFSVEKFADTLCDEDHNLARFFKLTAKDVGMMVKITEWGKVSAAQVAMNLAYGTVIEELEKGDPPPQVLLGHFMTELALSARRRMDINEVLLLAQESLYKCLRPAFVFTAFVEQAQSSLIGRLYVGEDVSVRARELVLPMNKRDCAISEQMRLGQSIMFKESRDRLGLPSVLARLHGGNTIVVPIIICGKAIGAYIVGQSARYPFTDEHLSWVEAVATHVAIAFERTSAGAGVQGGTATRAGGHDVVR
jgi:HD-like signal output (HDOD) protein